MRKAQAAQALSTEQGMQQEPIAVSSAKLQQKGQLWMTHSCEL